jgi:hypothetical protein
MELTDPYPNGKCIDLITILLGNDVEKINWVIRRCTDRVHMPSFTRQECKNVCACADEREM